MGILIRLNLVGNRDELNVVICNGDEERHESKVAPIADFNIPFNNTSNIETVRNEKFSNELHIFGDERPSEEESTSTVIDLTDEPSDESENASSQVTMGYYVVDKILGSRLNSQTNKHEFLLALKTCPSSDRTWNPPSDSQSFDMNDPDSVLYVQKSDDLVIPRQPEPASRQLEPTQDLLVHESWNSVDVEDTQMKYSVEEEDLFVERSNIIKIDLPEAVSEIYDEEIEQEPSPISTIDNPSVYTETKIFDEKTLAISNGSELKCKRCGLSFEGQLSWKKHSRKCSGVAFCCSFCPRFFTHECYLKMHSKIHENGRENRCKMCGYACSSLTLLRNHEKQAHRLRYQRKYSRSAEIIRKRQQRKKSRFECTVCSRVFTNEQVLQVHTRVHGGARVLTCTHCNRLFVSEAMLRKHELSQHELSQSEFHCNLCDKVFKNSWRLGLHKKLHLKRSNVSATSLLVPSDVLNQWELSPCSQCGKTYTIKAIALVHKNLAHSDDTGPEVNCIVCGAKLGKSSLQYHMYRHTGEKPFKCKYCDYTAIQKGTLKYHMSAKHGIVYVARKRKRTHLENGL